MYSNYNPKEEYRKENNPHTPSNIPENLEERSFRVFEHVETWSNKHGAVKYIYPKTEEGYNDYALMLDMMGFQPGTIIEYIGNSNPIRMFVLDRFDISVKWGERYTVENGGVEVWWSDKEETRKYTSGEGPSPKGLWKSYIYGEFEIIGHIDGI